MKKLSLNEWQAECEKHGLKELAKSIKHFHECPKHKLYHITKEALAYHKQIIHERDKKQNKNKTKILDFMFLNPLFKQTWARILFFLQQVPAPANIYNRNISGGKFLFV